MYSPLLLSFPQRLTRLQIGSSDFAAQARAAALNAGTTLQSGAKNATESFNRFVENAGEAGSSRKPPTGISRGAAPGPDRRDFWDSFGQDNDQVSSEPKGSLGTGAMKGAAGGGPVVANKGKTKSGNDSWGEDW